VCVCLCVRVCCAYCVHVLRCVSQDVSCLRFGVCVLQCVSGLSIAEVFCMYACRCVCLIISICVLYIYICVFESLSDINLYVKYIGRYID